LHLLKIGEDQVGSYSLTSVMVRAFERASAGGAWVFNLSYSADPDPRSLFCVAADRAATEFDLVICGTAGNNGDLCAQGQVNKGYFNGLIVGAVGMTGSYLDAVAPGSSRGPLAWPVCNPTTTTQRDGVNLCAPGGYWGYGSVSDGMTVSVPDETYTQAFSYGVANGVWAGRNMVGTSFAAPLVTGAAAALLGGVALAHDTSQMLLNSREVRAILLNQADQSISSVPLNAGLDAKSFGQGRLDVLASADFFARGGVTRNGSVTPIRPVQSFTFNFTQGQQVEITLTWDRVVFPPNNHRCTNLQLDVYQGALTNPNTSTIPLAQSHHPENNYERVVFTAPATGTYTVRARVPAGGFVGGTALAPPVPFALAIL